MTAKKITEAEEAPAPKAPKVHDPSQGPITLKDGDLVRCDADNQVYPAHVAPDGVARIASGPHMGRRCDGR